jgi:hypothetical protein
LWVDRTTAKNSIVHTPFSLISLHLEMQDDELNSTDISQRMNALLDLQEQRNHELENLKKRQQIVKKYFDKHAKYVKFKFNDKVLLWDSTHANKVKHSKFQKLLPGPYKITLIVGSNTYMLKDFKERLFSFTTNGSHLKHYFEPS